MRALQALGGMVSRSLENPSTPITGGMIDAASATPGQLWGSDATADPMRIGAVMRCVQILSSGVAGCPLRVHELATSEPVKIEALSAPKSSTTTFERFETIVAHLTLWGNAYVRKVRTRDRRIVDLIPIHPSRVVVKVEDGADVGLPFVKRFEIDGGKVNLSEYEIMHIPGLSLDGVQGLSVIGNMRRTFGLLSDAEALAARMYEQGLLTNGYITTEKGLDAEKATILQNRWRARLGGMDNAFNISILDNGAKFEQLTMSPADAQFLETRKFQTTEIARIFGVPGWIINDQEKSTAWGSGMEQQFISFVVMTLKPYFHRIEQRITREICDPETEKAEFKVEGLLRGDSKARAAFYASGIQHGWMVPNEPRELEDLPPVAWGDKPYRPFNESAGSQAASDNTPGDDDDDDDADA